MCWGRFFLCSLDWLPLICFVNDVVNETAFAEQVFCFICTVTGYLFSDSFGISNFVIVWINNCFYIWQLFCWTFCGGKWLPKKDRKSFPTFCDNILTVCGLNHMKVLFWFLVVVIFCLMFCWYLISCLYTAKCLLVWFDWDFE